MHIIISIWQVSSGSGSSPLFMRSISDTALCFGLCKLWIRATCATPVLFVCASGKSIGNIIYVYASWWSKQAKLVQSNRTLRALPRYESPKHNALATDGCGLAATIRSYFRTSACVSIATAFVNVCLEVYSSVRTWRSNNGGLSFTSVISTVNEQTPSNEGSPWSVALTVTDTNLPSSPSRSNT